MRNANTEGASTALDLATTEGLDELKNRLVALQQRVINAKALTQSLAVDVDGYVSECGVEADHALLGVVELLDSVWRDMFELWEAVHNSRKAEDAVGA